MLSDATPGAAVDAVDALSGRKAITISQPTETTLAITYDGRIVTSGELIRDLATRIPMADIDIQEPSAESIIRSLYEGTLRFGDERDGDA